MRKFVLALLALSVIILVVTCRQPPSVLEVVQADQQLVVLVRPQSNTLHTGRAQSVADIVPKSFEQTLVERFAQQLQVTVQWQYEPDADRLVDKIANGQAHLGIGNLVMNADRDQRVAFGPSILEKRPLLVYANRPDKPDNLADIQPGQLVVSKGSAHIAELQQLQQAVPNLRWTELAVSQTQLLKKVAQGEFVYTVTDALTLAQMQRYHRHLQVAFEIGAAVPTAWIVPAQHSESLRQAMAGFFAKLESDNELAKLQDEYFGHLDRHNEVDLIQFNRIRNLRLAKYWPVFEKAGEQHGFDPRLLAAVGYQESYWNPEARSPTGVRGLMMLTNVTAKEVGVTNRTDAEQSIFGGAAYLASVRKQLQKDYNEPDLTWFTLASYNIGLGHLRDAMDLAEADGKKGDRWVVLREYLPKLRNPAWYEQTFYGYARGDEAVTYVENIRSYFDLLKGLQPPEIAGESVAEESQQREGDELPLLLPKPTVVPVIR